MRTRFVALIAVSCVAVFAGACMGGSGKPKATPTPKVPGPEDVIADWARQNRNVDFIGDCAKAKRGVDVGKLCVRFKGERGTRRAYDLGPTFSDPTALALLEQEKDGPWKILSVTNYDPSEGSVPGIAWPLQVGDRVVFIGLGLKDCLRIHEQPKTSAKSVACEPDGTTAIIQEGPVQADTFTWWRVSGTGFDGWAVDQWMRLPEAIAQALQPPPTSTPSR